MSESRTTLSAREGFTYDGLIRALGVYSKMPRYSINSDAMYVEKGRPWSAHDVIICAHAVLTAPTTVRLYELDDIDRETVARLRETLAVHSTGVELLNVSDTVRSALELLIDILDSGVAA